VKNAQIRLVVVLGVFAILGIISVQVYWLRKAYDIKERQFNETIHTALQHVAENLASSNGGNLSNEDIVNQLSSDYFVVNINDVIDANTLEYYLKNEFEKFQINLDFEYAIYDCKSDKMVYGNYVKIEEKNNHKETVNLPTYNEFNYYFGVYLPTKSNFVINNLRLSIVFSLILLLAVVFFAYAIYVILQQKRLSELQTDFINNMTHEFKTPISSIALSSEAMMKNELVKNDPRLSNYTRIVKEQAERLNLQVEKVLQIAQLQTNELDLYLETLNLQELIEGVIRSTNVNYEKLGGKITFENKVGLLTVNADKMHLTNILHNLLDNSLKYNENVPEVTMILTKKEEKIQLEIKDNGIGIEEKYLKQVFDKFYRIPTGNVHNVKGFGLGLYYVKQVIKKHKWKINIKSELAKGTEVLIEM
jgi:two-component system phosphate regulon sensor histidine kinase PhoR